jgi:hypothetical protein
MCSDRGRLTRQNRRAVEPSEAPELMDLVVPVRHIATIVWQYFARAPSLNVFSQTNLRIQKIHPVDIHTDTMLLAGAAPLHSHVLKSAPSNSNTSAAATSGF